MSLYKEEQEEDSQTSSQIRKNIVKIVDEKGKFFGTGFFISINHKKYLITCHHCICNLIQIKIQKHTGDKYYYVNWIEKYSDPKKDIAVLDVEECPFKPLLYNLQALPNLEVIIWGYSGKKLENFPDGMPGQDGKLSSESFTYEWPWSQERIVEIKNKWNEKPKVSVNVFQYNGEFELGFSGAPVCYKGNYKVIGMFIAKDEKNGYVLPIQTILDRFSGNILEATFDNQDNSSYLKKGNQFHNSEDYKSAIYYYDKIISDPNYFYAIFNKALSLRKLGNYHEAIDWYNKALNIEPKDKLVLRGKGLTLHYLNKDSEAVGWYNKALEIDPYDVRSLSNKGISLLKLSNYSEAKKCFEKALAIDPNYIDAIEGLKQLNHLINEK